MSKYFLILSAILLLIWGCGSSSDFSDLTADERLSNAIKLYEDEDFEDAATEFESLLLQYPGNSIVDDAQYYLGMCKFQREEFILSAFEFSKLIKNMPASEFVADAQFMLAESYYELSPDFTLDQNYTKKAIEEYQAFVDFFPLNQRVAEAERKISELNDKLGRKEYSIAVIYEKMEYYTASLKYYDAVVEIYHDTQYAPMALHEPGRHDFRPVTIPPDRDPRALVFEPREVDHHVERLREQSPVANVATALDQLAPLHLEAVA